MVGISPRNRCIVSNIQNYISKNLGANSHFATFYRSDVKEMFPITTKICDHSNECILSHNYWYHTVFYWLLFYYMFLLLIALVKFLSQILSMTFECYRLIFTIHLVSIFNQCCIGDLVPIIILSPFI